MANIASGIIVFTGNDRLHAQWDIANPYGGNVSIYWVVGANRTLVASGAPRVVGQERRANLPAGVPCGYMIESYGLPDSWHLVTAPTNLSGTMLYDETFNGIQNLSGSVTVSSNRTLRIENSGNVSITGSVLGTLQVVNSTNVNITVGVANGTLAVDNCRDVSLCASGSGGNGMVTYNRFKSPVTLNWTGANVAVLGNIFDSTVSVYGNGYQFEDNTFYSTVTVGAADPIFEENVFLGCLTIASPLAVPQVKDNSFLGRWGIDYTASAAPGTPICIGPNYYGDPSGPIVPGQVEWTDRTEYPVLGGRFLSRDGALVRASGVGTYLVLDPPQRKGAWRTDTQRFPDVWCNGIAFGHNVAPHRRLDQVGQFAASARAGLPWLISVDVRGWDPAIRGVRVYADIGGKTFEADRSPDVCRDPYSLPAGTGRVKHGGTTFNIIVPSLDAGAHSFELYLDTRGITGYGETGGTNRLLTSGIINVDPAFRRPLHVMVVAWEIGCPGYAQYVPQTYGLVEFLEQKLSAMLPLRRDEYKITVHPPGRYVAGYTGLYEIFSSTLLFHQLRRQLTQFLDTYNASAAEPVDRLLVVVPHGVLGSANGMAGSGVNHMFDRRICVMEDSGTDAAIHEMGHSFGLWTGPSGEQYSWWNYPPDGIVLTDVTAFSPDPQLRVEAGRIRHFPAALGETQWHDVMGRTEPAWPVPETWGSFYGGLRTLLGTAGTLSIKLQGAIKKNSGPPAGHRRILIRALVDHRYRIIPGTVRAADVTDAGFAPIYPPDRVTGDRWYEFSAFDAAGTVVTNYRVVLEGLDTISTNAELGGTPWQATFDYPNTAVRCEWRGGQYDWTLYWEAHATNPISCTLLSPSAGTTLSNTVNVAWRGTATTPLLYRFMWSTNGGTAWFASGDFTEATNANWPVEFLPPTTNASFKIVASDGIKTAEAQVNNLRRLPSTPVLTILSPRDGDRSDTSNRWTFVAQATDPHLGVISNIVWSSSCDGALGLGPVLNDVSLSPGTHTIRASVTGIGGVTTQSVQVAVVSLTNIDLQARAADFVVQPLMFDPVAAMPNFMAPGQTNHAVFRVRNEGVTNLTTLSLALFMRPPGGVETLLASNTFRLAAFEEAELEADLVPTTNGLYEFWVVISDVAPLDTNTANNQCTWSIPCGLGNLLVAFDPPEVASSAYWSVNGGPWQPSGATVSNLTAGMHTLSFQVPAGYLTPSNREVEILSGRLTVYRRLIEKDQGYLRVTITPADAVAEGALWQLDGKPEWYGSGTTLSNVAVGSHVVAFRDIPWWGTPQAQTVTVAKAVLTQTSGNYTALPRPPPQVILGGPPDGATNQPLNTILYWYGGGGTGARVYFGTNPVPQASDLRAHIPSYIYSYDPGPLEYNTTYYWRIDPTNSIGVTTGAVWRFTTKPPGPEFTSPLYVEAEDGMIFNYRLTAIRATQVGAENLPSWLHWTPPDTLSGIPNEPGLVFVPVWAANATQREDDVLVINVQGGTSTLNWQPVASGTTVDLLDVTFGGGMFVAVGEVGTVLTSTNGTTWVSRSTGRVETLRSVTWGNGRFVAVGTGGVILTSTNGVNWTTAATGTVEYNGTCWGSNLFVAVGYSRTIRTSTNGTTWVNRGTGGSETLGGVVWGTNGFVTVGGLFSEGPCVFHSADGVTWTWRDTGTWANGFYDIAWGNGMYVAAGYLGKLMTSTNGIAWTTRYGLGNQILRGVAFYENQFLVVGHGGVMFTSHRGCEWTSINSGTNVNLHAAAGGLQKFVVVGKQGAILVADYQPDRDGDGAPDWQERIAGTDPLDSRSVFRLISMAPGVSGPTIGWHSETGRIYTLYRATNLTSSTVFVPILSNITGQAGTMTITDTNAQPGRNYFYRLSVREIAP